jgi:general secretion pathway protein J
MTGDRRGFTLLEMIVALSIIAIIAASIVVAFRLAGNSIEGGEAAAREMARLRAGIGILERTIRSADRAPVPGGDTPGPFFLGERERVRFLSAVPLSGGGTGGFRLLCFSGNDGADPGGAGMTVAEGSPFRADGAATWEGEEGRRVFLSGAREVAFSYSAGPTPEGRWEWAESWDARENRGLPAAVRVEFTTSPEGSPLRTSFVVPVLAEEKL